MDEDTRKRIYGEVRRSLVRISFNWKTPTIDECGVMVIPGVIISITDGCPQILADSTFFLKYKNNNFRVNFPNLAGYEEALDLRDWNIIGRQFCMFSLNPRFSGYIKAARVETSPLQTGDHIAAFTFPREVQAVPLGCTGGSIVNGSLAQVSFHDSPLHEYGYLGTPLFNCRGDYVGLSYLDFMRVHVWTVGHLQHTVLYNVNSILYVLDGVPEGEGEGPMAEAQVEE